MSQNTPADDYRPATPFDDEKAIVWLYETYLFPLVREEWVWTKGKARPIFGRAFNDHRLLVGYSTLRPDVPTDDGYLRRVFFLLPKDIAAICAYWNSDGEKWAVHPGEKKIVGASPVFINPCDVRAGLASYRYPYDCFENLFAEIRKMLEPIFDVHVGSYPKRQKTALMHHNE